MCIISIFLNLLKLFLCPNTKWFILGNVSCALENNMHFTVIEGNCSLCLFNWFKMLFKSSISLLLLCLDVLFIFKSGVLDVSNYYSTTISPLNCVNVGILYFEALCMVHIVYNCYIFLMNGSFYQYIISFFVSYNSF